MPELTHFLDAYGLWLFLGLGFAEFAGLPIATVPLLVAAGGLAAMGAGPGPVAIAAVAALGGWIADAVWYALGRIRGHRLIDFACNLSSNPKACLVAVCGRLGRVGPGFIALSKFIPGTGNLIASAAGIARYPAVRFLGLDAVAVLAWAGAWVGLGRLLHEQVETLLRLVLPYAGAVVTGAAVLVVLGFVWRFIRARLHRPMHEAAARARAGAAAGDAAATPAGAPGRRTTPAR